MSDLARAIRISLKLQIHRAQRDGRFHRVDDDASRSSPGGKTKKALLVLCRSGKTKETLLDSACSALPFLPSWLVEMLDLKSEGQMMYSVTITLPSYGLTIS